MGHPVNKRLIHPLAVLAAISASSAMPLVALAAPTCVVKTSDIYRDSFIARDITVTNTGGSALSNWKVDVLADQAVTGTKVWGDAKSFAAANKNTIRITPSASSLAPNAVAVMSLKGDSAATVGRVSCQVVGTTSNPPPPPPPGPTPPPPPGPTPPPPSPPPSGEQCGQNTKGSIFNQGFDTFTPGTPSLNDEKKFKNEFCIPLRNVNGFGNDAEPPISSLSGKEREDRLAREAKGQYNGASSTVRVTVDRTAGNTRSGQSLRVLYPQGTNTSSHSGAQFDMNIPGAPFLDTKTGKVTGTRFDEDLYISYWVKFENNFDWAFGGKLPGFYAIEAFNSRARDNEVKSRLMWREGGKLEFYLHTRYDERERLFWNNIPGKGHFALTKGKWHNIEFRMKLNTVTGGTAKADGILQGWLDGQLAADYRDLRFRTSNQVNLNTVYFSTFHGGSSGNGGPGEIWWPSRDVYAWFDEFIVSPKPIANLK